MFAAVALLFLAQTHEPLWKLRPFGEVGLWLGGWSFEAETATRDVEVEGDYMLALSLGVKTRVSADIEGFLQYEFATGQDLESNLLIVGAGYVWEIPYDVSGGRWGQIVGASLGLLAGRIEVDDSGFPGDFDFGFGGQAAIEYRVVVSRGFAWHLRGGVRYSRFQFDADGSVAESDDSIGGFAAILTVGVELGL